MKITEGKEASNISKVVNHSDPFAVMDWLLGLDHGKFGSVTKEIDHLLALRSHMLNTLYRLHPSLANADRSPGGHEVVEANQPTRPIADSVIIDLDDEQLPGNQRLFHPYQEIFLKKPAGEFLMRDFMSSLPPASEVIFILFWNLLMHAMRDLFPCLAICVIFVQCCFCMLVLTSKVESVFLFEFEV